MMVKPGMAVGLDVLDRSEEPRSPSERANLTAGKARRRGDLTESIAAGGATQHPGKGAAQIGHLFMTGCT